MAFAVDLLLAAKKVGLELGLKLE